MRVLHTTWNDIEPVRFSYLRRGRLVKVAGSCWQWSEQSHVPLDRASVPRCRTSAMCFLAFGGVTSCSSVVEGHSSIVNIME